MGNSGSQSGQITQRAPPEEQQWAHSFPRTQPRLHHQQPKVLPERDARQKLRHTNNGDILQSGGTLSGRHQQNRLSFQSRDDNFINERPRTYLSNQRDPLHKSGARYTQNTEYNGAFKDNMKKFGSEPDLRQSKRPCHESKERRGKKKYRAPPPPVDKSQLEWDDSSGDNCPTRRARLFKTRAETKKNYSSPVHKHKSLDQDAEDFVEIRDRDLRSNRLSLPEMVTPNFHQELKEVTKRLRHNRGSSDANVVTEINNRNNKEKLKTLDHNIHKKDNIRQRLKQISAEADEKKINDCVRGDGSGKESSSPDQTLRKSSKDQPKMFYFGMDDSGNNQNDDYNNDIVDHFASNLHTMAHLKKIVNSSESDISSEIEADENPGSRNGIDLQLRPILPKKQLEIPRFSPAAAWKLLSAVDSNQAASTIASDDVPVFIEDRIEKYARPPPPTLQIGQRSNNDKSGDSGISGDAGPTGYDDSPEVIINTQRPIGISWTPQQDLGDDSSMEEGLDSDLAYKSSKPHVFSLSLPRDNHLSSYMAEKRTLTTKKDFTQPNLTQEQSDNWFLSKSAPNSLNNGFNSLELKPQSKKLEETHGRLMYLPEIERPERSRSVERSKTTTTKLSVFSKSCENINEIKSSSEPEDLQDPPKITHEPSRQRKAKRFTFQSTVRQIERRRLAEKLSREAERKEKQRLRELEAMQKVEEEFQKKRAREKASIRQQLRLFSMDDVAWSSLPPNLDKDDIRPEPDGAVSSSATSSPSLPQQSKKVYQKNKKSAKHRPSSESSEDTRIKAQVTQVLSEYRHPQREYKEYTGSTRYLDLDSSGHTKTTVHPQVTCNMPKAKQSSNPKTSGTNYRKDFAHGVKGTRSVGSTYSEESQSRNNSPRMYHNKHAPMTRF